MNNLSGWKRFGDCVTALKAGKIVSGSELSKTKSFPNVRWSCTWILDGKHVRFQNFQPGPVLLRLLQYGNVLTLHTKRARKGRSRLLKMAHWENITLSVRLWICKKTFTEIDITCCGWLVEPYNFLVQKTYCIHCADFNFFYLLEYLYEANSSQSTFADIGKLVNYR